MTQAATLNLNEFIYRLGNDFFNLREEDFTPLILDDLNYEITEKDGLNGYVLKFEETADAYSNKLMKYLMGVLHWFQSFFYKNETLDEPSLNSYSSKRVSQHNTHTAIHNKVRSRLLDVINEDIEHWNIRQNNTYQEKRTVIHKNCFKADIERESKTEKSNMPRLKHLWNKLSNTKVIE